jgi:uncharacterized membrane protein YfcA
MTYSSHDLLIIALVMTFGSVLQGMVGFASGLLGVPMLVVCGFSLVEATVINFISTGVQNATGAVQLWNNLDPRELVWPATLRMVGLPLGVFALGLTEGLDHGVVNQIIGVVLLMLVVLLAGFRVQPRERLHQGWTLVTFVSSGFLMGFASIGGAPMVVYVNSLTWPAAKSRGFLFFCSGALMPLMAALIYLKFGDLVYRPAMAALLVLPPVLIGLGAGLKLGDRLDKERFRQLTYAMLVVIALAAIFGQALVKLIWPAIIHIPNH